MELVVHAAIIPGIIVVGLVVYFSVGWYWSRSNPRPRHAPRWWHGGDAHSKLKKNKPKGE